MPDNEKGMVINMKTKVIAVVPARREDSRLNNKNILPFNGVTLLHHKIKQLKDVEYISEILVSSEDDEILKIAENEGVSILKRPLQYSDRNQPFGKFVEYICMQVKYEHILWACVTAPFVTAKDYDEAVELYLNKLDEGYDSLITVQRLKRFILDRNGSINFKRGMLHKNSEELSDLFLFTNGIVLAPREDMIKWKYNWGHVPYMLEIDKKMGIDINDSFDYEIAKLLMWKEQNIEN